MGGYLIDLQTNNVDDVVNKITSCKFIATTSLHGLIVAHAYGIPAIWYKFGNIGTDGFKFRDYFSSVGILPYEPIELNPENFTENFYAMIDMMKGRSLPNKELLKTNQLNLAKAFTQMLKDYNR